MEKTKFSLTNREISENFNSEIFHLMIGDFTGAFAYQIAARKHKSKVDIEKSLNAWINFLQQKYFTTDGHVEVFTYEQLNKLITEDLFIAIPEIYELNQIKSKEFYDLGALARNVFFMICREQITQPL